MINNGHIFLSYARHDGEDYVTKLSSDLESAGYTTWQDKRNLNEYHDFSVEIELAIQSASFVVVCITPSIEQNPDSFVRREILYAQLKNKLIIPLVFPGSTVPIQIVHLTWVSFAENSDSTKLDYEKGLQELLDRLSEQPREISKHRVNDLFASYLQNLYDDIVAYLDRTVYSLITLYSQSDSHRTQTATQTHALPMAFWDLAVGKAKEPLFEQKQTYHNFHDAFRQHNGRILLLGDPGSGKTTTVMAFARTAITKRLHDSSQPLPVLVPVTTWDAVRHQSLGDWITEVIPSIDYNELMSQLLKGNVLLLLDGLDELGDQREDPSTGEIYDPRLRFLEQIPSNNKIVLTSRLKDYDAIGQSAPLTGCITLQPLSDEQIESYLSDFTELWQVIKADEDLKRTIRTPLLLSLFTFAFAESSQQLTALEHFSQGDLRDEIFGKYVQNLYHRASKKLHDKPSYSLPDIYEILGQSAMTRVLESLGDTRLVTLEMLSNNSNLNHTKAIEFVAQMANLGLILPVAEEGFRFIHLLLRDYFAFNFANRLLKNPNVTTQEQAILALCELRDPRSLDIIMNALVKFEARPNVIWRCIQALGDIGDPSSAQSIASFVYHNEPSIRIAAANTLRKLGDHFAVYPLLELANDRSQFIKKFVAEALSKLRTSESIQGLIEGLSHNNQMIARACFNALVEIGEPSVLPLIQSLQNDYSASIRALIIEALGTIGDERAIQTLKKELDNQDQVSFINSICDIATDALKNIGTKNALEALDVWKRKQNN